MVIRGTENRISFYPDVYFTLVMYMDRLYLVVKKTDVITVIRVIIVVAYIIGGDIRKK